jgi:uncharacterized membrane protein YvbJ
MFCPNCGKQIPDDSKFCPYCGYQIAKVKGEERVQTIELTSKRLKKQLLYSVVLIIVGLILIGSGKPGSTTQYFGGFFIFVGFVWLIVTRIKIWWNHK